MACFDTCRGLALFDRFLVLRTRCLELSEESSRTQLTTRSGQMICDCSVKTSRLPQKTMPEVGRQNSQCSSCCTYTHHGIGRSTPCVNDGVQQQTRPRIRGGDAPGRSMYLSMRRHSPPINDGRQSCRPNALFRNKTVITVAICRTGCRRGTHASMK